MRIISDRILKESLQTPCEGIFWFINNHLIALTDPVDPRFPEDMTDLMHKDSWNYIKDAYKVNGKLVDYDYFPRGRVEVIVRNDSNGNLIGYEASVFMDRCINKKYIRDEIEQEFRLYLPKVSIEYCGQLFFDGSHYVCNDCR